MEKIKMAAAFKTVLGGFAVAAAGLIIFSGQSGVIAAEGSRPVSVALASGKVSTAAELIAAMGANPSSASVASVVDSASSERNANASAAATGELLVAAPLPASLSALVPTPESRPDMTITGATVRRAAVAAPVIDRGAVAPRRASASASAVRTRGLRPVRVVDEEPNNRPPRRLFTIPLPPIIGAYR